MAVVVVRIVQLRTSTYVNGFLVELVHIIEEGKVIVRVRMQWVQLRALLKMLYRLIVLLKFEVS